MATPLKVGLVGTGDIAWSHLTAYQRFPDQVKLTALCDIREGVLREFAAQAKVDELYTDYHEMLNKADIDAVVICTYHNQHASQTIAAAAAGKHVLVEKPMGCNMEECRDMVAAVERAGIIFMVGQHLRFLPHTRGIKRLIDDGELGTIRVVSSDLIMNMPVFFPEGHWFYDGKIAGGGMIISGIIHMFDLMRYYVGEISSVSGVCRTVHSHYLNGAEEYAYATLEFENGAIGNAMLLSSPARSPYGLQYVLYGDEGTIYADSTNARSMGEQFGPGMVSSSKRSMPGITAEESFTKFAPIEPVYDGLPTDDPYVNETLHFAECCQQGKEPINSGKSNLETVKVVFGVYDSARTGEKIDLANL